MYNIVIFLPSILPKTSMDAMLVTGPVNKNTNAEPTDKPFVINVRAIGIEAVEHIYIGSPTSIIASIERIPLFNPRLTKKSVGTNVAIIVASNIPTIKWVEISSKNLPYA